MLMTNQESISLFLNSVAEALKQDQASKDMRASGASAASLREESNNEGSSLWGSNYWQFQITGRGPGKFPPIENILAWLATRNIQADISPRSLAFLIARKIARVGSDIFKGAKEGIDFKGILAAHMETLKRNLGNVAVDAVIDTIRQSKPKQ